MSTTTAPVVAPTPCPNESNRIALEGLMTEFFSPTTTNERKAEIEQMLSHFQAQKDSWRPSLEFLARTQNHYVAMFAISTIEVYIQI